MLALIISNENGDINVVEQLSSLRLKNRNWYSEGKKNIVKKCTKPLLEGANQQFREERFESESFRIV